MEAVTGRVALSEDERLIWIHRLAADRIELLGGPVDL
jgi:hypothetical protein